VSRSQKHNVLTSYLKLMSTSMCTSTSVYEHMQDLNLYWRRKKKDKIPTSKVGNKVNLKPPKFIIFRRSPRYKLFISYFDKILQVCNMQHCLHQEKSSDFWDKATEWHLDPWWRKFCRREVDTSFECPWVLRVSPTGWCKLDGKIERLCSADVEMVVRSTLSVYVGDSSNGPTHFVQGGQHDLYFKVERRYVLHGRHGYTSGRLKVLN
jgi:hypothetical protein